MLRWRDPAFEPLVAGDGLKEQAAVGQGLDHHPPPVVVEVHRRQRARLRGQLGQLGEGLRHRHRHWHGIGCFDSLDCIDRVDRIGRVGVGCGCSLGWHRRCRGSGRRLGNRRRRLRAAECVIDIFGQAQKQRFAPHRAHALQGLVRRVDRLDLAEPGVVNVAAR